MLVMQFAPAGERSRALFFESESAIRRVIGSPMMSEKAKSLIRSVERTQKAPGVVASETDHARVGGLDFSTQPYILPVLDHRKKITLYDGTPTVLLKVGSINSSVASGSRSPSTEPPLLPQDTRIGAAFVIDTTISMQPYIDKAKEVASRLVETLTQDEAGDNIRFGLIGYRNNKSDRPGLEYVTKKFVDFGDAQNLRQFVSALSNMREASVSTHRFSEDAIAGLYSAIHDLDWRGIDIKVVFLITDAGAIEPNDPKARHRDVSTETLRGQAKTHEIAIVPIHLLTPQAEQTGNRYDAEEQYLVLGETGDINRNKYFPIEAGSERKFEEEISQLSDQARRLVRRIRSGKGIARRETATEPNLGDLLVHEVFRVQQKFIGAAAGDKAPAFLTGWTVSEDLTAPKRVTMTPGLLLTRNQLDDLARSLRKIVNAADRAGKTVAELFDELRGLAAGTHEDPRRYISQHKSIVQQGLLPKFLEKVPYPTRILDLTRDKWISLSYSEQQALIDEMVFKLQIYSDIAGSDRWISFVKGNRGEQLYPIPLEYLP
tara:strand:+ start:15072 stop:16709 length:1638 start_codon:yes stop_codon:yes gene_type:complete